MPITGYYRPDQSLLSGGDQEAAARNANAPAPSSGSGNGWTGTIGGQRMFFGGLPSNATQAQAEAYYRNSRAYQNSAGGGFLTPGAYNAVNPNATSSEQDAYAQAYADKQNEINYSRDTWAGRNGMSPIGVIGAGLLAAAGGAALAGGFGGGAGAAGASGSTAGGAAGGAGAAAGGAAGTAGGAAAGGAAAGGAGAAGTASAIPEIIVTGSSGGLTAGGAAGAAGSAAGAGSFWNNMHNAASDTSSLNATNEQYLNNLEAPTAQYGVDWMDLIKRGGSLLGNGQGGQQPPMGGGIPPGLMGGGGGGGMASGVAPQRSRVMRSPLEQYMALSRIGLLGDRD